MREILWRCAAVGLAAAVCWLTWPRQDPPAPTADFLLEHQCTVHVHTLDDGQMECWRGTEHVLYGTAKP
jgi:hypothetical protein